VRALIMKQSSACYFDRLNFPSQVLHLTWTDPFASILARISRLSRIFVSKFVNRAFNHIVSVLLLSSWFRKIRFKTYRMCHELNQFYTRSFFTRSCLIHSRLEVWRKLEILGGNSCSAIKGGIKRYHLSTVDKKSHDSCFCVFLIKTGVKTFVAHCAFE